MTHSPPSRRRARNGEPGDIPAQSMEQRPYWSAVAQAEHDTGGLRRSDEPTGQSRVQYQLGSELSPDASLGRPIVERVQSDEAIDDNVRRDERRDHRQR